MRQNSLKRPPSNNLTDPAPPGEEPTAEDTPYSDLTYKTLETSGLLFRKAVQNEGFTENEVLDQVLIRSESMRTVCERG